MAVGVTSGREMAVNELMRSKGRRKIILKQKCFQDNFSLKLVFTVENS